MRSLKFLVIQKLYHENIFKNLKRSENLVGFMTLSTPSNASVRSRRACLAKWFRLFKKLTLMFRQIGVQQYVKIKNLILWKKTFLPFWFWNRDSDVFFFGNKIVLKFFLANLLVRLTAGSNDSSHFLAVCFVLDSSCSPGKSLLTLFTIFSTGAAPTVASSRSPPPPKKS